MSKTYSPIPKTKAPDLIVEEIWAAILNGDIQPGERLPPERVLVEEFNVSKVTLREALQSLEANGYIERKRGAGGGAVVLEFAPTKGVALLCEYLNIKKIRMDDLISLRLLIDPQIAENVARTISDTDAHQLELFLEKHKRDYSSTGKSKFGWHFEQYLAKLNGNHLLDVVQELLVTLVKQIETDSLKNGLVDQEERDELLQGYYKNTLEEHLKIAQAILERNPEKAREAMAEHRTNWARIFKKLYSAAAICQPAPARRTPE